ncbi:MULTISPECIES: GNAT family N-acetyltransferase [Leucobacter]|uniref:Putative acetyltransferase n=1 Tax=Leucobacter chromiiresistens TaxID=1079994 RepID=A0A1H0YJY2_9MICO|nr:GNAT family N-acetyltransferase [Leucobacter chromiiresistens]SDQ15291.1 putative acetyltransferase [Leucobacter chromiiresistens]
MSDQRSVTVTQWNAANPRDCAELTTLLTDYHLRTESEKGNPVGSVDALPEKYRFELTDPQRTFSGDTVLVARYEGHAAGCLVITTRGDQSLEIKRLWTDENYRGRHIATSLLTEARNHAVRVNAEVIQLSVWKWRSNAIALYKKVGFTDTSSWEDRDQLICMVQTV